MGRKGGKGCWEEEKTVKGLSLRVLHFLRGNEGEEEEEEPKGWEKSDTIVNARERRKERSVF